MLDFDTNDLRVAKPCPVGWESMSGDDRTRFCRLCELNVYNISEMTAAEVRALVENSQGRICGRLYKRADGSVLTSDCPVGLSKYRKRAAKYCGAVLGAVFGLFSVAFGQQTDTRKKDAAQDGISITAIKRSAQDKPAVVRGIVTDANGAVVPDAKITITFKNKEKLSTTSNSVGEFTAKLLSTDDFEIKVESSGFNTCIYENITVKKDEDLRISVILGVAHSVTLIGVVGVSDPPLETRDANITTTVQKRKLRTLPF